MDIVQGHKAGSDLLEHLTFLWDHVVGGDGIRNNLKKVFSLRKSASLS